MTETTTPQTDLERLIALNRQSLDQIADETKADGFERTEAFSTYRVLLGMTEMHMARHTRSIAELSEKIGKGYNVVNMLEEFAVTEAEANVAAMIYDNLLTNTDDHTDEERVARADKAIYRHVSDYRISRSTSIMHNFNHAATAQCWAEYARVVRKQTW